MTRTVVKKPMRDSELIDAIKDEFGWRTDLQVAKFLGLSKDAISLVRGGGKLGRGQRLKLYDRLKFCQVRNLIARIAPDHLAARLIAVSRRASERLALRETEPGPSNPIDVVLLEHFKRFGKFASDSDLATFLGIRRNTISMVRAGRSKLGPLPRLRMLSLIEEQSIGEAEKAIESSEFLLKLIKQHGLTQQPAQSESPA